MRIIPASSGRTTAGGRSTQTAHNTASTYGRAPTRQQPHMDGHQAGVRPQADDLHKRHTTPRVHTDELPPDSSRTWTGIKRACDSRRTIYTNGTQHREYIRTSSYQTAAAHGQAPIRQQPHTDKVPADGTSGMELPVRWQIHALDRLGRHVR